MTTGMLQAGMKRVETGMKRIEKSGGELLENITFVFHAGILQYLGHCYIMYVI